MNRELFLRIFPDLGPYWDMDQGIAAMEVMAQLAEKEQYWQNQWELIRGEEKVSVLATAQDMCALLVRRVPLEADPREVLDSVDMARLDAFLHLRQPKGKPLKRSDFLVVMETVQTGKVDDRYNCILMAQVLFRYMLQEGITMGTGVTFEAEDETGSVYNGEIVGVFEMDNREYAVYILGNETGGTDILVSRVGKDQDGFDELQNITSDVEHGWVIQVVNNLIRTGQLLQK